MEHFQKWSTGGISQKKCFRHFPVHGFLSEIQDAVMKKIEKPNNIKNVLGIKKNYLHFVGSDLRKSILSQIFLIEHH